MRFFISIAVLTLAVAAHSLTDEQKKKVEEYTKTCLKESQLDEEVLKKAEKFEYSDDPKLKVHALCFSKKIGLQDEKGEFQLDVIKKKLVSQMKNEEEADKLIVKCLVKKDTPEEAALEALKCFHKNLSKDVSVV